MIEIAPTTPPPLTSTAAAIPATPTAAAIPLDVAQFDPAKIPGPKLCLSGAPGVGKTTSIFSMLHYGMEVACLYTEAGGAEAIIDAIRRWVPEDKQDEYLSRLFLRYVAPANPSWEALFDSAEKVNSMDYESLCKMRSSDKNNFGQYKELISCLANFVDERTGRRLGAVDFWPNYRVLVLDGLSGINVMARDLTVGSRSAIHQGEWGVSMDQEERLLMKIISSTRCWFILITHVDREFDEVANRPVLTIAALGRKLAPKLGRFFGDILFAYREMDKFYWANASMSFEAKFRLFPVSDKFAQNFIPGIEKWLERYHVSKEQWLAPLKASAVANATAKP